MNSFFIIIIIVIIIIKKNNRVMKEKYETFFRPIYVDQIPHKSLGAHVNVFSNKLN